MNHLGNILSTISDRKLMHEDLPNNAGYVHHYTAEILSVQEQYAFGMNMPGRSFSVEDYRFGFNGKETQNELMGDDNAQDFGARMFDARVGRWWGMDYMKAKTPGVSPFVAMANNPILFVDPDGMENTVYLALTNYANTTLTPVQILEIVRQTQEAINIIMGSVDIVKVQLLPEGDLSKDYLDESDAVAVLGTVNEVKSVSYQYFRKVLHNFKFWKGSPDNPEHTEGNFIGVDVSAWGIGKFADATKSSVSTAIAFSIVHGLGHTLPHGGVHGAIERWNLPSNAVIPDIIKDGNTVRDQISSGVTSNLRSVMTNPNNSILKENFARKFRSDRKPADNIKRNKQARSWKMPRKFGIIKWPSGGYKLKYKW